MSNSTEMFKYPIGNESTTVRNVFRILGMLEGTDLRRAIDRGLITVDDVVAESGSVRVYPGQRIRFGQTEILVCADDRQSEILMKPTMWCNVEAPKLKTKK